MAGIAHFHAPHVRHLGHHRPLEAGATSARREERPPFRAVALMFVVVALLAVALTALCELAGRLAT